MTINKYLNKFSENKYYIFGILAGVTIGIVSYIILILYRVPEVISLIISIAILSTASLIIGFAGFIQDEIEKSEKFHKNHRDFINKINKIKVNKDKQ